MNHFNKLVPLLMKGKSQMSSSLVYALSKYSTAYFLIIKNDICSKNRNKKSSENVKQMYRVHEDGFVISRTSPPIFFLFTLNISLITALFFF